MENEFMREAIRMADESVRKGELVIVKNGKIIAKEYNTVLRDNDSTAHMQRK